MSRLSVLMKDWFSAYSDSESAGDENKEFVERSSMEAKSWRKTNKRRKDGFRTEPMAIQAILEPVYCTSSP